MSSTPRQGLRRELRFSEAIALSLAIMAPTAAMALNGTAVAGLIGRAVPLAFLIATIGVLFVSYGFVRLTRHFNSAGSVFALAGATLGPRAGFFAGFALMATYTLFTVASAAEIGLFGQAFLEGLGAGSVDWLIIALVAMVFVAILAFGDIRVATRSLLGLEGISVLLILVLIVVIFAKVLGDSAPSDQDFTLEVFSPPGGIPFSTVAIAAVFGFLSFGGFEGAVFYLRGERRAPIPEVAIPLIALAIIVYVLYQNTLADSLEYPYTVFPLVVAGWLALGLAIAVFVPGLARRVGEGLAREEGLAAAGTEERRSE